MPRNPKFAMRFASLLPLAALVACGDAPPPQMPEIPVKVATVELRDVERFGEFVGELVPAQEVELRARTSGILLKQHVADGEVVEEGQLLFTIEALEAEERRAAALAQLEAAHSQLAATDSDVSRYAPLLPDEAIARQVYDNAVAARDAARAAVEAQQALVRQADLALDYAKIRSPLTGHMGAATVAPGDLINAGSTPLVIVSADDPLWIYVSLSETELLDLAQRLEETPELYKEIGPSLQISLANGRIVETEARINFRDRALDPITGTYRVRVELDNAEIGLLPGQFVRVRLLLDRFDDVVVVSARAVEMVLDQAFVQVVNADRGLERRPVMLGHRLDGEWVVSEGLASGETYVVEGAQKVRPGMRVLPQPADAN